MKLNMYFLIKNKEVLKKCNKIWDKGSNTIKEVFDNEPIYNEKYLKIKIESQKEKSTQIFKKINTQKKVFNMFVYH